MTIFVIQGETPLTESQLHNRTQAYIERDWPSWKRERSMRRDDGELDTYLDTVSENTDTNRTVNVFNTQLVAYNGAVIRLAKYVVSVGRAEITEMQPTGEQVLNAETGEMDDVMASVIIQTAVEPLPATVEVTTYDEEGEATVETVTNPLITADVEEREQAQNVVDATPLAVQGFE